MIYGLGAIKGVGESAIEGIVEAREAGGHFKDLLEFCRRIDLKRANKRVLEALIHCGALDNMGENRATLMQQLPTAIRLAEQHHATRAAGQNDLFGIGAEVEEHTAPDHNLLPAPCEEWEDEQRLAGEKETLGLYLTGHPIDRYESEMRHIVTSRIGQLSVPESSGGGGYRKRDVQRVCVAGLVMSIRRNQTQRGTIATLLLDDRSGRIEATLFSETQEEYRDLLDSDKILVVSGGLSRDDFRGGINIRVEQVHEFEQAREIKAKRLNITIDRQTMNTTSQSDEMVLKDLAQQLKPFLGGQLPIQITLHQGSANGAIQLGDEWRIHPSDELMRRLTRQFGVEQIELIWR